MLIQTFMDEDCAMWWIKPPAAIAPFVAATATIAHAHIESSKLAAGLSTRGGSLRSSKLGPGIVTQGAGSQPSKLEAGVVTQGAGIQSSKMIVGIVLLRVAGSGVVARPPLTHW
jgi:hypothetical protein